MMGPVGRCLETALDELLAEDDRTAMATRDDGGNGSGLTTRVGGSNESQGGELDLLPPAETIADGGGRDCDGFGDANGSNCRSVRESTPDLEVRLDDALSRSILDSYRKAVVETQFDRERKPSSASRADPTATTDTAAPASMLKGEIDHFNRIGGQWRVVVKNAVLKRRSLTTMDNGMPGRSCRKRTVLDWDDDDYDANVEGRKKSSSSAAPDKGDTSKEAKNDSSGLHHFLGTIQILAYDDT